MNRTLRFMVMLMGVACVAIGVMHFALGTVSVPGEGRLGDAVATVDSRERFYGAIFAGYGAAWVWAGRQSVVPASLVRALALIFLAGGVGRLLSMVVHGQPQWFQTVLTVIELVLPPVYFWLVRSTVKSKANNADVGVVS